MAVRAPSEPCQVGPALSRCSRWGARQNSSRTPKHRSFDSSFPSLPSVGFSRGQAGRRITTEANKENEELGQAKKEKRINRPWFSEYTGFLGTFYLNARQNPLCEDFCHAPLALSVPLSRLTSLAPRGSAWVVQQRADACGIDAEDSGTANLR